MGGMLAMVGLVTWALGAPPPGGTPPSGGPSAKIEKHKLGPQINSPTREAGAIPSPDGRYLYVTREGFVEAGAAPDQIVDGYKKFFEVAGQPLTPELKAQLEQGKQVLQSAIQTVWRSERQRDGTWGPLVKLPAPLNPASPPGTLELGSAAILSVLPDNNTLLIGGSGNGYRFVSYHHEGKEAEAKAPVGGALAFARRVGSGWGALEFLDIDDARTNASRNDFAVAPNNQALILALQNKDALGLHDLFVSMPDPKTKRWSHPRSLGPVLNSKSDEMWPFLAADGVTLYFTSNRPGGLGKFDMWMSRRQGDGWEDWSPPVNLGPEVNTAAEDLTLSVDASGNLAFIAIGEMGKEDIFEFRLPEAVKPLPVAFVRGRVRDPKGASVAATIVYHRLRDGAAAGSATADPVTGEYQIALPIGEAYGFRAEASGYVAVSEHVSLVKAALGETIERDLTLIPIAVGAVVRLNNVFFRTGEAVLLPESKTELDRVVAALEASPRMAIEIAGHTDAEGDAAANQALSEARATAVVTYLSEHGIAAKRLVAKGYGETKPVAANTSDEGRQENRRVELIVRER